MSIQILEKKYLLFLFMFTIQFNERNIFQQIIYKKYKSFSLLSVGVRFRFILCEFDSTRIIAL